MTAATTAQIAFIDRLAKGAGFQSGYYAASAFTGESISRLQRKGFSKATASAIIDALQSGELTSHSH